MPESAAQVAALVSPETVGDKQSVEPAAGRWAAEQGVQNRLSSGALLVDPFMAPCDICAAHVEGRCDACGEIIPEYANMSGHGYQSPSQTHFHLKQVASVASGREAFYAELCRECYRLAWREKYPDEPLPV